MQAVDVRVLSDFTLEKKVFFAQKRENLGLQHKIAQTIFTAVTRD